MLNVPFMQLHFLGANRQVTGSRYVLKAGGLTVMVDCGLFQERLYLSRNWEPCPIEPASIDVLLLTHAHLDHCGLIPKLVREGFAGKILATVPTIDLARIVLEDSARIQEEDAAYKKKRHQREGRQGPHPDIPLYTSTDVEKCLPLFQPVRYDERIQLGEAVAVRYRDAGHILGSAVLEIDIADGDSSKRLVFSGDIGQWDAPLMHDPTLCGSADYVVMESTYGDRDHEAVDQIDERLAEVVNATLDRGGNIVIPTFAIDRAQDLIYHFSELTHARRIPRLPIFLDSPMAVSVTELFRRNSLLLNEAFQQRIQAGQNPFKLPNLHMVRSSRESREINALSTPAIIMAGAGMCTGGRIKHHLRHNIGRPESTILFVGYQAEGTLGREIVSGVNPVRIHGEHYQVRARIERIDGMSAHADRTGLLRWLQSMTSPPQQLFLTHGEEQAAQSLAEHVRSQSQWNVEVPAYGRTVSTSGSQAIET